MHDALVCCRRFRTFNVVDDFNREALEIEIDLNISAQQVVRGQDSDKPRISAKNEDGQCSTTGLTGAGTRG